MSAKVFLSAVTDPGEGFVYDSANPTKYTEALSYNLHLLMYLLGANGGFIEVAQESTEGTAAVSSAVDSWSASFQAWLTDAGDAVSAWLLEEDTSRALPAIPLAPLLLLPEGALATIGAGIALKVGTDIIANVARVIHQVQAARRDTQVVRLLDRSLNKTSWFGLSSESYLSMIADELAAIRGKFSAIERDGSEERSITEVLQHGIVSSKLDGEGIPIPGGEGISTIMSRIEQLENVVRVQLQIYHDNRGDIEEIEFV